MIEMPILRYVLHPIIRGRNREGGRTVGSGRVATIIE